jgi:hypothetical protein
LINVMNRVDAGKATAFRAGRLSVLHVVDMALPPDRGPSATELATTSAQNYG